MLATSSSRSGNSIIRCGDTLCVSVGKSENLGVVCTFTDANDVQLISIAQANAITGLQICVHEARGESNQLPECIRLAEMCPLKLRVKLEHMIYAVYWIDIMIQEATGGLVHMENGGRNTRIGA
ncbi:hypothetical protein Tco_1409836 [Tanacetum coccineum]